MTTTPDTNFNAPKFLIITTTIAAFGFLVMIFLLPVPNAVENVLYTLIGGVVAKWQSLVDYFFGSSSGSKAKSDTINEMAGTGDGTGTVTTKAKTTTEKTVTVDSTTAPAIPAWLTGTPYKLGDIVTVGTSKFRALADHTSAVTDEPGVGNDWSSIWERQA